MVRKNKISAEDVAEKKKRFEKIAGDLEVVPADKFLKDNFLPYAWSYILDRSLTDVSGLKPVQRRILYTMYKEGLSPQSNRSKVATLAGKVLAFHPHGDASVSDALKNLARAHIFRVPLIDGKGDFGVPGTPGAAPRYIEARLNKAAWINVEEIAEKAVSMVPNYDGNTEEPVRIPVRWPVSVINGSSGMAIGYASAMPSHNPTEIMKACKALVRNPGMTTAALSKIVLGPDYNMGGTITSNDGIKEYLETGAGKFKLRGNYDVITGARNTHRIEFHEIPFGTNPEKIIAEIQAQMQKGRLKDIASYKDLSDLRHPIRLIIETKPSVNYKKILQELFKYTSLESPFSVNMTTIVDNKPVKSAMKDLLLDFINFRKVCILNKSKYSLGKKNAQLHLLEGLLKTLLDIDAAIAIIRKSDTVEDANVKLQRKFKIDEVQAKHVLDLQLRKLTKMDKNELESNRDTLRVEVAGLTELLSDEEVLKAYLISEFDDTLKIIGDERRTEIVDRTTDELLEAEKSLVKEVKSDDKNLPCFVARFEDGRLLKSDSAFAYMQNAKKIAHTPLIEVVKLKTQDFIVVLDSAGVGHKVPLSYLPDDLPISAKDMGLSLPRGVRVVGFAKYEYMKSDIGLAIGTCGGEVKLVKNDFPKGADEFPLISLKDGDSVVDARWIGKALTNTYFSFVTSYGNILLFDAKSINPTGHKAGGVRGIKLKADDDSVIQFGWVMDAKSPDNMLVTYSGVTIKSTLLSEIPTKNKGGMGVATQIFKSGEKNLKNAFVGVNVVACALASTHNSVAIPALSKRSARGVDFNIDVLFGSYTVDAT